MKVILYTTHCPICEMLKSKLEEKHIKYVENTNVEEMKMLGLNTVPALSVDNEILGAKDAIDFLNKI